jgi:exonuclease III
MNILVATWNTQWATNSTDRGLRIASRLETLGADVAVVTEGVRELLPSDGFIVDAGDNWGYGPQPSRRKVIVWSRFPLSCDAVGESGATRGRLAVATAQTPSGPLRIVGVCIPWRDAHVTTGRRDASPWSEHLEYLDQFTDLLAGLDDDVPTVIVGDFNQRIPRERQPIRVADRLNEVLAGWAIHTAGVLPNGPHIDHIATNQRLARQSTHDWAAADHLGRLSDHAGVACRLRFEASTATAATPAIDETRVIDEPPSVRSTEGSVTKQPETKDGNQGMLTAEMRAEIENVLRSSGEGLSHGASFQLQEQGLSEAEIADRRGVTVQTTRGFLRSVELLLEGTLPRTKSLALINSWVYRELLNHHRSDSLDSYVKAQLRELKKINPDVSFEPLKTRSHQYRVGKRR